MSDIKPPVEEPAEEESLRLAEDFVAAARELGAEPDVESVLARICQLAQAYVPDCRHAAISLVERRSRISTHGATDELPAQVDRIQYDAGEGPCMEVISGPTVVSVTDLDTDGRWPTFARRVVAETGVRSMIVFRLFTDERTYGALNLYSTQPGTFDEADDVERWGAIYSAHASLALEAARKQQNLRAALASRESISIAVGVLMANENISRQRAFDILRRASQRMNVKLRDIADAIAGQDEVVTSTALQDLIAEELLFGDEEPHEEQKGA